METHLDYGKVISYGRLAKALIRKAAGVQLSGHDFDLAKALESVGLGDHADEKTFQDEKSRELIKDRKKIAPFKMEDLQQLPDGTLGRAYADFMSSAKREPKFFEDAKIEDDTSYRAMRMAQTQDMWQVLSGFDESAAGKAGFNAFVLAQTGDATTALSMAAALTKAFVSNPADTKKIVNEISRGWLMGLKAEPLFAIDWEQHWVTPLSEMKRRYLHFNQLQETREIFDQEDSETVVEEVALNA